MHTRKHRFAHAQQVNNPSNVVRVFHPTLQECIDLHVSFVWLSALCKSKRSCSHVHKSNNMETSEINESETVVITASTPCSPAASTSLSSSSTTPAGEEVTTPDITVTVTDAPSSCDSPPIGRCRWEERYAHAHRLNAHSCPRTARVCHSCVQCLQHMTTTCSTTRCLYLHAHFDNATERKAVVCVSLLLIDSCRAPQQQASTCTHTHARPNMHKPVHAHPRPRTSRPHTTARTHTHMHAHIQVNRIRSGKRLKAKERICFSTH